VSTTDADSGFFMRHGKPQGFFYLEHRTVDAKYAIVTDAHITPGNVGDPEPYLDRLLYQTRRFGFSVEAVGLDAGYHTGYLCKKLLEHQLFAVMSYRRPSPTPKALPKRKFRFVPEMNLYVCPMGCMLTYRRWDKAKSEDPTRPQGKQLMTSPTAGSGSAGVESSHRYAQKNHYSETKT
jgi:hypothetical protein